jgi:hypothetical protein
MLADQHNGEARRAALARGEFSGGSGNTFTQAGGERLPVDQARGHPP